MRRILALLVCAVLFCLPISAATLPNATSYFVNDYADVLSDSDQKAMEQQLTALQRSTSAQLVVVTIATLDGEELSDYSLKLARKWGIGDKEKNNGVLLLFVKDEERVRIEVGRGLEGALPDSKAGRILDTYMLPYYKDTEDDDYSTALRETTDSIVNEIYIEYGIEPDDDYQPITESEPLTPFQKVLGGLGIIALIVLFIRHPHLFYILLHFIGRGGGGRGGSSGGFSGGGGSFSGGGAER